MSGDSPKVAVLCGGLGTRLGALSQGLPKPMIPIGGRPYLERVVESFASSGLRSFLFLTGYRADVIEQHFGDGSGFGVRIDYSTESEPMGTGGAIRDAAHLLGSRFLLTYGDVLRRFDYAAFAQRHDGCCVAVYPKITRGNTEVRDNRVVRFDKKADLPYVDAGFSIMTADTLALLPPTGTCSFEERVFPRLAEAGRLQAEIVDHDFYDIGVPEELERTRASLEAE